jgi:virginiamycin A acetyltransferase
MPGRLKRYLNRLIANKPEVKKINPNHGVGVEIMPGTHCSEDSFVGMHTYIGYNCFVTKSKIGAFCSIGNNVAIGDGEHPLDKVSTSGTFYTDIYNTLTAKECIIENDVWIGAQSIIRRGVSIGNGAVVGANSFVNKDVPPFAIVAGTPARIIRYRFNEQQIRLITSSAWWELDKATAINLMADLQLQIDQLK